MAIDTATTGPGAARPPLGQERWPDRLAQFLEAAKGVLDAYGLSDTDDQQAMRLAADIVLAIADDCGGFAFYLPHGQRVRLALRDRCLIIAAQQGATATTLAADYELSATLVKAILSAERRRQRELRQRPATREEQQHRGSRKVRLPWQQPLLGNQGVLDL